MRPWARCYKRYLTPSQDKDAFPARQLFVLGTSPSSPNVNMWQGYLTAAACPACHVTASTSDKAKELCANFPVQHYAESASQSLS